MDGAMAKDERGFDDVLTALKGVVEKLESGQLGLEASLGAFEEGVALARQGAKILDEAERRVEILTRGAISPDSGDGDAQSVIAPFADSDP
jgi:exodeoxyribonuclease VII small subunit